MVVAYIFTSIREAHQLLNCSSFTTGLGPQDENMRRMTRALQGYNKILYQIVYL